VRIAQVAPLFESVPPREYGGTERVVSYLTEELVRLGHDVTLFASADSTTRARLVPMAPRSLRQDPDSTDTLAHHVLMLEQVARLAHQFDVLHWHIDYLHFPISRRLAMPNLTTLHGRLDITDLQGLYREFSDMPVVSISNAQREPLPHARWVGTVYHGLPESLFTPAYEAGEYLVFLGRISPEKRVDRAIEVARRAGLRLRIGAKIDDADAVYYREKIAPLFELPFVEFIGEVTETEKEALLRGARALLFPIDWREPFGLVMIEAMACGTPVIAWNRGSVPEVIDHGVTGYIVDSEEEALAALSTIDRLDRHTVRAVFERRFAARTMARAYVDLYARLLDSRPLLRAS